MSRKRKKQKKQAVSTEIPTEAEMKSHARRVIEEELSKHKQSHIVSPDSERPPHTICQDCPKCSVLEELLKELLEEDWYSQLLTGVLEASRKYYKEFCSESKDIKSELHRAVVTLMFDVIVRYSDEYIFTSEENVRRESLFYLAYMAGLISAHIQNQRILQKPSETLASVKLLPSIFLEDKGKEACDEIIYQLAKHKDRANHNGGNLTPEGYIPHIDSCEMCSMFQELEKEANAPTTPESSMSIFSTATDILSQENENIDPELYEAVADLILKSFMHHLWEYVLHITMDALKVYVEDGNKAINIDDHKEKVLLDLLSKGRTISALNLYE